MSITNEQKQWIWLELLKWQLETNTVNIPHRDMDLLKESIINDPYIWSKVSKFISPTEPMIFLRSTKEHKYFWLMGYMTSQVEMKYQLGTYTN